MTTGNAAADHVATPPPGDGAATSHRADSPPLAPGATPAPPLVVAESRWHTSATTSPRVYGLDLSLTGTGVAGAGWAERVGRKGKRDEPLTMRAARIDAIADQVWLHTRHAQLVVIESPISNYSGGSTHDRSGLWWLIVGRLIRAGVTVVEVNPNTRLGYATGNGNTRRPNHKAEVVAAVSTWHPWWDSRDNNEADALVLHAMGMAALGQPVAELPETHTRFLATPDWPDLAGDQP